jgi:acetyl/propionyl-CoA carboxylase alpha subunit
MRLVHKPEELERVLGSARREALGAFDDDRVYLERAVQGAHHVEIQILADGHGDLIHLGERECSIQRRHQKLVEEAPSPTVDRALRQRMAQTALRAASAVDYVNAGTVEFLLGADGTFYFLEMNTRLQVEHPTTESITGVDIVKEQLRIAAGEPLRYAQEDVKLEGWSIECRITAEDPFNGFLPSGGHIVSLNEPSGPGIRVDSGMYEGLPVSSHYDPLLAKLVAWGSTREEALCRMRRALEEYRVIGLQTSIPFHKEVLETQSFIDGKYDTSFLDQNILVKVPDHRQHQEIAAITATLLHHSTDKRKKASSPTDGRSQPKLWKLTARREGIGR